MTDCVHFPSSGIPRLSRLCGIFVIFALILTSMISPVIVAECDCSGQSQSWHSNPAENPLANNASQVNVTFLPTDRNRLVLYDEGEPGELTVIVRRRASSVRPLCICLNLTAITADNDPSVAPIIGVRGLPLMLTEEQARNVSDEGEFLQFQFNVSLFGLRLGRALLMVTAQELQTIDDVTRSKTDDVNFRPFEVSGSRRYSILVVRPPQTKMASAFLIVTLLGMTINMLSFSVRLHTDYVRHHIRHPFAILVGLGCQFTVLPAVSYLVGLAFDMKAHIRYMLLVLGCCPGGGPSNIATLLLHGDIHLSVIMTCFSNFLSIGVIPLWTSTLGVYLMRAEFPQYSIPMPWEIITILGLVYSIPAVIGNLFRRCVSERTAVITSLGVRAVGLTTVLVGVAGVLYCNVWTFRYIGDDWRLVVGTTLFCHVSYIISFLLALIGRRSRQTTITIALETGFQSFPTALTVSGLTCPAPESSYAYPIVCIYLFNIVVAVLIAVVVTCIIDSRNAKENKSASLDFGHDATPVVNASYSMSKIADGSTDDKFSVEKNVEETGKPDIFGTRNGSFMSLVDKY